MTTALGMLLLSTVLAAPTSEGGGQGGAVSGELKLWHCVTIDLPGPRSSETAEPNPFCDYRLDVTFAQGNRRYVVPGYFAADGRAAESAAVGGNCWRVHFVPDAVGRWTWRASFRGGPGVATSDNPKSGRPLAPDGASGSFDVGPSDKSGRDFRASGMLRYVGEHYLQFAGSKRYFIKGGADSPENLLAYADFDGTRRVAAAGGRRKGEASVKQLHRYTPHLADWKAGDPTWRGGKGKALVGAMNYLASRGMNSVYFLTMNVGGDGKDVWPWIEPDQRDRYDCSKLDQWEIVFSHMDRLGLMLHVITQETENDQLLDGGDLGPERRLYYRELIARFGHHLAVVWNLGEENTNTDRQRREFLEYINRVDPYRHPIVVHSFPNKYDQVYTPLLGNPHFSGPSLQMGNMRATHAETLKWVQRSAAAGHKWFVSLDEIGPANTGVKPDADDPEHDEVRRYALWGNLMAGGAGVEWYFGYKFSHNDLNCEDWRSREKMWDQTRWALEFFQKYLPFVDMRAADELTTSPDDYCLAQSGKVYAIYLPGGTTDLAVPAGRYRVKWYNPRQGDPLVDGSVRMIVGPGRPSLGSPPTDASKDWVVLVVRQ